LTDIDPEHESMSMHHMERNSRSEPIRQDEFHRALGEWFEGAEPAHTIGDTSQRGQTAWVWIRHLGHRYYLNADTRYDCVGEYLALLKENGGKLEWRVGPNLTTRRENKTLFGRDQRQLDCMYLYRELR
jgi:hypothetical protein